MYEMETYLPSFMWRGLALFLTLLSIVILEVNGGICTSYTPTTTTLLSVLSSSVIIQRVSDTTQSLAVKEYENGLEVGATGNYFNGFQLVILSLSDFQIKSKVNGFFLDCGGGSVPRLVASPLTSSVFGAENCLTNLFASYTLIICRSSGLTFGFRTNALGQPIFFDKTLTQDSDILKLTGELTYIPNCELSSGGSYTAGRCFLCNSGYVGSNSATCSPGTCNVANCLGCSSSNVCWRCDNGIRANSQGNCQTAAHCLVFGYAWTCSVCEDGYRPSGDLCVLCPNSNCKTCDATACLSCLSGFHLNSTDSKCYADTCVDSNCIACQVSSTCLWCNSGFHFNATDSYCYANTCNDNNCATCKNPSVCLSCLSGFHFNSTDSLCYSNSCDDSKCTSCRVQNACLSCLATYHINSTDSKCYADTCSDSNCIACQVSSTCLWCNLGFHVNSTDSKCYSDICNDMNCASCKNPSVCLSCLSGFHFNSTDNLCYSNICDDSKCTSCRVQNACLSCISGFHLNSTDSKCYADSCVDSNCIACQVSSTCLWCNPGFHLNSTDSKCYSDICNDVNCASCKNPSVCLSCLSGLHINSTDYECYSNTCDDSKCMSCKVSNVCLACQANYHVNSTDNLCYSDNCDDPNCYSCRSANVCLFCFGGYVEWVGKCYISVCAERKCELCSSDGTCVKCESGYSVQGGKCFSNTCLVPDCTNCLEPQECATCVAGTVLLSGRCTRYVTGRLCDLCEEATSCLGFDRTGPGQFDTGVCTTGGCEACVGSFDCSLCIKTTDLINRVCGKEECQRAAEVTVDLLADGVSIESYKDCWDADCRLCSQPETCDVCYDNFVLLKGRCAPANGDYVCQAPTSCVNCLKLEGNTSIWVCDQMTCADSGCLVCVTPDKCVECRRGFDLGRGGCVERAPCPQGSVESSKGCEECSRLFTNCAQCKIDGCEECFEGFVYVGGECIVAECPVSFCRTCESGQCKECLSGYSFDSYGLCIAAECFVDNCLICEAGLCRRCQVGLSLINGHCLPLCVDPNCTVCPRPDICEACMAGFAPRDGSCVVENCPSNCVFCDAQLQCLACADGYVVFDFVCLSVDCTNPNSGCSCAAGDETCLILDSACGSGNYEVGGECRKCSFGCRECVSGTICLICLNGLHLESGYCIADEDSVDSGFVNSINCQGRLCLFEGIRTGSHCPHCQVPCKITVQQISKSVFRFKGDSVIFRKTDKIYPFLTVSEEEGSLIVNTDLKTGQVIIFTLVDYLVEQATCLFPSGQLFSLQRNFKTQGDSDSQLAAPVYLSVSSQVISMLGVVFPFVLAFLQYNDLLQLYYYSLENPCSFYTFINDLQNEFIPIQNRISKKSTVYYPFYNHISRDVIQYFVDNTKKLMIYTILSLAIFRSIVWFLYRRQNIYLQLAISNYVNVPKIIGVLKAMIESLLISNSFDILVQCTVNIRVLSYNPKYVFSFSSLLITMSFIFFFIYFVLSSRTAVREFIHFQKRTDLYTKQQVAGKCSMVIDVSCTIVAFCIISNFQNYQFVFLVTLILIELFKIIAFGWIWLRVRYIGLLFLCGSEVVLLIFFILEIFKEPSNYNQQTVSNILYVIMNAGRITAVGYSIYTIFKAKKFVENFFEFNFT